MCIVVKTSKAAVQLRPANHTDGAGSVWIVAARDVTEERVIYVTIELH